MQPTIIIFRIYLFISWIQSGLGFIVPPPALLALSSSARFHNAITAVTHLRYPKVTPLQLNFNDFFNRHLFGNTDDDDDENNDISNRNYNEDEIDDEEDRQYDKGTSNIFRIKLKSMKTGGCRLYLSLYLIGEVNNPEKRTWKMDQTSEGGIDMYYKDASGALTILFEDDSIIVNRLGSAPSMNYLMHESSVLNGLLDQLDEIAFDKSIHERDRLITLNEPGDAINVVRESLSFT